MTPEKAETYLRKHHGQKIETGCIREACENSWISYTLINGRYHVEIAEVIRKYIK